MIVLKIRQNRRQRRYRIKTADYGKVFESLFRRFSSRFSTPMDVVVDYVSRDSM